MYFRGIERRVCGFWGEDGCFWGCIGRLKGSLGWVVGGGGVVRCYHCSEMLGLELDCWT